MRDAVKELCIALGLLAFIWAVDAVGLVAQSRHHSLTHWAP